MAASTRNVDPAFQGAGQKGGIEIWRIENFKPVPIPASSYGKFFTGDSYVVLKTTALRSGSLQHEIHYWLGKDTSQDEAGAAALKTIELDAALGGRAVQYREVQGHETEKFLSYFKPCIIPQEGGVASGFKHTEPEEHKTRLFVCKGKHVVNVSEVPFARSSLNHDDIFILDTKSKIFQFSGSNSSIQERGKALEVVQYIKDSYHDGKCDVTTIEDGKLMADAETGEFWGFFGGFAPLPRKTANTEEKAVTSCPTKIYCIKKGKAEPLETESLSRGLLDTYKCYVLDFGLEVYVWMGKNTSLDQKKSACTAAEELIRDNDRPKCHMIRVIEGFETVMFKSKFDSWPHSVEVTVTEEGKGKVAALLKRQGVNVKGLLRADPVKEEPKPHIDCTGKLQVWRVNGEQTVSLSANDQSKFYSGDCYIFQYSYAGEDQEEQLIGTWFGKQSVQEERASALSLASQMIKSMKFMATQARFYEGNEPVQFFSIFQSFVVFKGGLSDGYKKYIEENGIQDETYKGDGVALFRVQGSGPDFMQAYQVDPVASSLNSSYCYILQSDSTVYTWAGSLTTANDLELAERQVDLIKPNIQSKVHKEGGETDQFWNMLGGKSQYLSQKISRDAESDPHLFSCTFTNGNLKVTEIYNFTQDDLMTEDIYILDCCSAIYIWVGQQVNSKDRLNALTIGKNFVAHDFLMEKLSPEAPFFVVMEGSEPPFFTRFFNWDSAKSLMQGNSFERKLAMVKNGGTPRVDKPKRRTPVSYDRRSSVPDKSQRTRSVSFSPERVRVRGRSPAFNALAANFENSNARNLSTPPPVVRKIYPKSVTPDSAKLAPKYSSVAAQSGSSEKSLPTREPLIPKSIKGVPKSKPDTNPQENSMSSMQESPVILESNTETVQENSTSSMQESSGDPKTETETLQEYPISIIQDNEKGETEDDKELPVYPYEQLKTTSTDPVVDIDVTKRESYLSAEEFQQKFGMAKNAFYKLPKWKQNKLKMALQLF